jgi:Rhodopirellula transposase DDE domain
MDSLAELTAKFHSVWPLLDERTRRLMAASEAKTLGYGGVSLVRRACGLSRKAISKGVRDIEEGAALVEGRIRRPGAGRKLITVSDPRLVDTLEEVIDHQTRGDPESALRWICKSTRAIAKELDRNKHPVSHAKVAQLLHHLWVMSGVLWPQPSSTSQGSQAHRTPRQKLWSLGGARKVSGNGEGHLLPGCSGYRLGQSRFI